MGKVNFSITDRAGKEIEIKIPKFESTETHLYYLSGVTDGLKNRIERLEKSFEAHKKECAANQDWLYGKIQELEVLLRENNV